MRFKLTIEYDGRNFVGWQWQENGFSVQQALEEAIKKFCGEAIRVYCAGRTDSGVHALGQVCHIDLERPTDPYILANALNAHLRPHAAAITRAEVVDEDFHARISAKKRVYRYRIINRRAPLTIDHGFAWRITVPLDTEAMHDAAQALLGKHDFTSFRAQRCQADSPVRTLDRLDVVRDGEEIFITAEARSFLHHQIRNFVGTLKLVGEGKWTRADVEAALTACDRAAAGPTAPPEGLYFVEVVY